MVRNAHAPPDSSKSKVSAELATSTLIITEKTAPATLVSTAMAEKSATNVTAPAVNVLVPRKISAPCAQM